MTSGVEDVVRRYFEVVADLGSTEDELRPLLAEGLRVTEHPNAITPQGAVRDLDETVAGFRAGKALLSEQAFEVEEIFTAGDRVAVKATWRGTVGVDAGPFPAGLELVAHVAALLTVRGGVICEHETFDCYEPIGPLVE
ncbi:nuclear transport factor 2 family protein [Nocardioides agariphilus]|jgi:ketosteroid isomerase-like protein|uniref:Nuclear transport factor 2 family protein n=1 Tax=Nocardioides agariphilus TaxID=433664 RepID=A0A930YNE1_9ACTN|nr:nuclear transport factor 2 family protein [Nocardioides agariphilus]MBF4766530.1 nuclear transport factor 2 family protein [Nocardioides agariphilus]